MNKCLDPRPGRRRMRIGLGWWLALSVVAPLASGICVTQRKPAVASNMELPHYRNTSPGVGYVGSRTCAHCHTDIYNSFIKTDMGRSVSLPESPEQRAITTKPVTVKSEKLNRYFEVFRKGSNIYQSEFELGADGKTIFRNTHKVEYVVGAGVNGFTYVIKLGNYLFEAPLSYYSRPKRWELSPGYKAGDFGFSRPLTPVCVSCHTGFPRPVPDRSGLFKSPPFREMAVGCENCHGPGELHVKALEAGILPKGKVDHNIVNPANLPGWLADNTCMKCHQMGDARILQPGKSYADFRPGTPLDNTVAIFAMPFTPQHPPQTFLLQHYELMLMSKCYRMSGEKLHCITCHDPHYQPSASEAPAYYRQKCLKCHTVKSCSLPMKARLQQQPPDNCIGCHMPKENLKIISHSALTNHRIIAYKGEPFPEAAYHQTTSQLPDLIHLDAIPGNKTPPPPIVLLQAYGQLAVQDSAFRSPYLALLRQLERTQPDNPLVLSEAGQHQLSLGTAEATEAARKDFARAVKRGSTNPSDFEHWARTLAQTGDLEGAISVLKRGLAIDPYYALFYRDLTLVYIAAKQYSNAIQTIQQELSLFPQDSSMRGILDKLEAGDSDIP